MKNNRGLALSKRSGSKGFTLIELLVVIAIIGILAGIVLTSLGAARNKAKDVALKEQMSDLRNAIELYATINGSYEGLFPTYTAPDYDLDWNYYRCDNKVINGSNLEDYNADLSLKSSLTEIANLTSCSNIPLGTPVNNYKDLCIYCKSDGSRYIVVAKLPSSSVTIGPSPSWCIDSSGLSKRVPRYCDIEINDYNCP